MFHNSTVNDSVHIDNRERHCLAGRFDTQPRTLMNAPRCQTRDHPFAFGDLFLDRKVKIAISLASAEYVFFGTLNSDGIPLAVVDFFVLRRDEVLDSIYVPGVDNLFVKATHEYLIFFRTH